LKALGTVSPHGGRVSNRVSAECRRQKPMPRTIPGLLGRIKITVGATTVGRPSSAVPSRRFGNDFGKGPRLEGMTSAAYGLRPTLGCQRARRGLPPYALSVRLQLSDRLLEDNAKDGTPRFEIFGRSLVCTPAMVDRLPTPSQSRSRKRFPTLGDILYLMEKSSVPYKSVSNEG
jgi:hypothetical protein